MKHLLALLLALVLTGCEVGIDVGGSHTGKAQIATEYPTVNLPPGLRQPNWSGDKKFRDDDGKWQREGSCVHATIVSLLRWQGHNEMANYWRQTYNSGETPDAIVGDPACNLVDKFEKEQVRYAYTTDGDVQFLEWAHATRRGAGVTVMGGKHMVALVHFDAEWAGLLDNNDVSTIQWVPRETFVSEWQNSNGWAVTPVYHPAPPLPTRGTK